MHVKVILIRNPQQCLVPGCGAHLAHSYHECPTSAGNGSALKLQCPTLRLLFNICLCLLLFLHLLPLCQLPW